LNGLIIIRQFTLVNFADGYRIELIDRSGK